MRNFNEFEKELLSLIISKSLTESAFRKSKLFDILTNIAKAEDVQISIKSEDKAIYLLSDAIEIRMFNPSTLEVTENKGTPMEFLDRVLYKLIVVINLLDYLEKNHLIYYSKLWETDDISVLVNDRLVFKSNPEVHHLLGGSEYQYIYDRCYQSILPTPELVEFVKNGFKDKEQIRHDANIRMQWVAIGVALFLGVISLVPENNRKAIYETTFSSTEANKDKTETKPTFEKRQVPVIKQSKA